MTAERGWKRSFDDPIPLPRSRPLVTLRDAAEYITKLPKAEHDVPEWQAAMEALLLGRGELRADDVRPDRRDAGIKPCRRAGIQSGSEGPSLGQAHAGAGSLTVAACVDFYTDRVRHLKAMLASLPRRGYRSGRVSSLHGGTRGAFQRI